MQRIKKDSLLEREANKAEAISDTAKILAHDLSRPFFNIKMGLDGLLVLDDLEEGKKLVKSMLPTINESIYTANCLIDGLRDLNE